MLVYNEYAETDTLWPEPIEQSWQIMPAKSTRSNIAGELASKMPHLGLADILLLPGGGQCARTPIWGCHLVGGFLSDITGKRVRIGGTCRAAVDKTSRATDFTWAKRE